ncbi:UDP-D-xylose:L-fucose alpha-1,3-D-xylosyltransferase 1-like isoform X2 [Patiria miniata]|nr:UDP-D-xylose:L-fucose alpha-1,3-D-xylosyltransferase 1-like isoform X2 [Patiria miniata]XP_038065461.1 UDP-D-xylose:L-fucose alpha-1,3-D-xylosyltransferase 1-like isoform X2 [Patiria miniata]XP_038065462.1 UDP-D-xylose:L-fucose alpha-1,3-D-xylosyltransferase 1-like isoform X2 [Patiria miniata]
MKRILASKTGRSFAVCAVIVLIIFGPKYAQQHFRTRPVTLSQPEFSPIVRTSVPLLDSQSVENSRPRDVSSPNDSLRNETPPQQLTNGSSPANSSAQLLDSESPTVNSSANELPAPSSAGKTNTSQRRIVLTTTNSGFLDFTENFLLSIVQTGVHPNVTIITEDEETYRVLSETGDKRYPGLQLIKPDGRLPSKGEAIDFGTEEYVNFINRRPKYVLSFIQQGFDVFFIDVDTFWVRNPFPYFQGNFDVAFIRDEPKWGNFNGGCIYYRPTERTVQLLKRWIEAMETQKVHKQDQAVLNEIVRQRNVSSKLRIKQLFERNFPSGRLYVKGNNTCFDMSDAVVFHASWIAGHEKKMAMMQKCRMWLKN